MFDNKIKEELKQIRHDTAINLSRAVEYQDKERGLLWKKIDDLQNTAKDLEKKLNEAQSLPTTLKNAVEDLELWRVKINDLAIEKTPTGRPRLSKTGKRIFGKH